MSDVGRESQLNQCGTNVCYFASVITILLLLQFYGLNNLYEKSSEDVVLGGRGSPFSSVEKLTRVTMYILVKFVEEFDFLQSF